MAIRELLTQIRNKSQKIIIADPGGEYLSRFYKKGDLILNIFDSRSVNWSPFAEIQSEYDFVRLAHSIIPTNEGTDKEWNFYAQEFFSGIMKSIYEKKIKDIKKLLYLLTSAPSSALLPILENTSIEQFIHPGNEKMLSNTRAVLANYLVAWHYIKKGNFSIRKWIRKGTGCLFITYRDNQLSMLKNLVSTWMDLAIVEGLSLPEENQQKIWYIMDELDSIGKISTLKDALTKLRKHGGCCIIGIQTISQLREIYGRDHTQTLLGNTGTKLILTAGDFETANYYSKGIGEKETLYIETSENEGKFSSKTITKRKKIELAVLPSEILNLPQREGFLRISGQQKYFRLKIPIINLPKVISPWTINKLY